LSLGKVSTETTLNMKDFIKSVELYGYFISFSGEHQPSSVPCRLKVELPRPHTDTHISSRTPLYK